MIKFIEVHGSKIWSVEFVKKNVSGISEPIMYEEFIFAEEIKTGTWYKCEQSYNGEDEPTWDRVRSWELDKFRHQEEEGVTEINEYDDYLVKEIEENNRYYVEDDVYAGHESKSPWREGFAC